MLASAIKQSASSMVKLVGRGALETGGSTTFGTPNSVSEAGWYDSKFSGERGGYWAIGGNVNGKMKVFKPFNVYSNANDKELLITNAKANGMTEADLIGISLKEDGSVIPEIGFEAYSNKLLALSGKSTAQQLGLGFVDVENFVKSLGLAASVADYMYNFSGYTSVDRGLASDGSSGVKGIKYLKDNGQSAEDYSKDEETYKKSDEALKRVMDSPADESAYFPDLGKEEREIPIWENEQVSDNFDGSTSNVPDDVLQYIKSLEVQLKQAMEAVQQISSSGKIIPFKPRTYEGSTESMPDYVTNPIKKEVSVDFGKEIGSVKFDADEVSCTGDLMTLVTNAVYSVFGDFSGYHSLRVVDDTLYINNTRFACKIDAAQASSIPFDIRLKVNSGMVASLFNYNTIYAMTNLQSIEVTVDSFFGGYVAPQLGCRYDGDCIRTLFSSLKNLKVVKIGKKIYSSDDYKQKLEGVGRNYNTFENLSWGSNAFFAKTFKRSKDLSSACLSLSKNPATGSNCQKFLARHGILRTGAKVLGTTAGAAGMLATGAGFLVSGALGLGSKAANGISSAVEKGKVKRQAKSFAEGLKDMWNN